MPLLGLANRSGRSLVDAARVEERHHAGQDTDHRGNSVGDVGHILGVNRFVARPTASRRWRARRTPYGAPG